jgi:hypothetical protein
MEELQRADISLRYTRLFGQTCSHHAPIQSHELFQRKTQFLRLLNVNFLYNYWLSGDLSAAEISKKNSISEAPEFKLPLQLLALWRPIRRRNFKEKLNF